MRAIAILYLLSVPIRHQGKHVLPKLDPFLTGRWVNGDYTSRSCALLETHILFTKIIVQERKERVLKANTDDEQNEICNSLRKVYNIYYLVTIANIRGAACSSAKLIWFSASFNSRAKIHFAARLFREAVKSRCSTKCSLDWSMKTEMCYK